MAADAFLRALERDRRILITVKGRRTGRRFTRPVWFVLDGKSLWLLPVSGSQTQWYRNIQVNPTITIEARKRRRRFEVQPLTNARTVRRVIRLFGEKYGPDIIKRLYSVFDAAVKAPLPA